MRSFAEMSRFVWWAFAATGAIALVAAAAASISAVPAPFVTGAWQLVGGVMILVAIRRGPGGVRAAVPFVGAGLAGVVLGIAGVLLSQDDELIALSAIGIWGVVAGAGYYMLSRVARAAGVPDGGLPLVAWAAIAIGIVASTLPAFGLGGSTLAPVAALAATGGVTILAALRLRVLPGEPSPVLSNREARRRERTERRP